MSADAIEIIETSTYDNDVVIDFVASQPMEEEVVCDETMDNNSGIMTTLSDSYIYPDTSESQMWTSLVPANESNQYQRKTSYNKTIAVPTTSFTSRSKGKNARSFTPGRTRTGETRCLEPHCQFSCFRIPGLRTHLEEAHGLTQDMKQFAFNSEDEFKTWLARVEEEARCTYMRRRGWQKNKNKTITGCFYCNRGGSYISNATKKQSKSQGSCKTGIECTSSMKVTMWPLMDDNKRHIEVEAYLQHYGHMLDLSHIRISPLEKAKIAEKLSNGISRHKILDEIRGSLDPGTPPHRVHLLSLQDIYNIEKKEGIHGKKGKVSCEPGTTVQAWIEKMQRSEDNPVLLIKYQQEKATSVCPCLSTDDFLLVLQTSLQSMMLRRHGPHQCVCIDITQGEFPAVKPSRADPNFHLMALEVLIPNPTGPDEVLPVAWFVSNRKDKPVIEICLNQIKNNLSDLVLTPSYLLTPSVGITSGCDWFEVWTSIFGSGPRKIIGNWHIVGEWRRFILDPSFATIARPLEGSRLIANLTTVVREPVVENFVQLMKEFLDDLKSSVTTRPFADHFERHLVSQPELWARAYKSDVCSQAEQRFEDYHSRLTKHIYIEGFKRKQLDVLIKTLMKYSRDKAMTKLRQSFRSMNDAVIHRMTSSNHEESVKLPTNFVTPREDGRSWSVLSVIESMRAIEQPESQGGQVKVTQVAVERIVTCSHTDSCAARLKCPYRCEDCEVCSHHVTCSCNQSNVAMCVLCQHCHLVCRYLAEKNRKVASLMQNKGVNHVTDSPFVVYVEADDVNANVTTSQPQIIVEFETSSNNQDADYDITINSTMPDEEGNGSVDTNNRKRKKDEDPDFETKRSKE